MSNTLCQPLRTAVVVLLATWTFTQVMAQAQGEYFIDEDPGLGYATPVSIPDDGSVSLVVPTIGLSPGNHIIGIRAYNTTAEANANVVHYGPTVLSTFAVLEDIAPQTILYAEYFWGDDPGYGKGIPIPVMPGGELSLDNLDISTAGMTPGDYTIGFRTLGSTGWGPTVVCNVTVMAENAPQSIVYAEYFWNDDPGYGQGIPFEVEPGEELSLDNLKLSTYGLEPGAHTVGFRALGTTGWGPTVVNNVEVMEYLDAQEILYAEYFWDEDPGYGLATSLAMTKDQLVNFDNIDLNIDGLTPGDHVLGFRSRGTTGWGPTVIRNVLVMPEQDSQQVLYAEYFLDDDPGYGLATPITLIPGKEVSISDIEIPSNQNYHLFGFRSYGTSGWGPTMLINVDADVYCDTIHAVRVQEVTLPIKMTNASAVGQFEMTLTLPDGVTVATDKNKLQVAGTTRLDGFTITTTTLADNSYRIVATPAAGSSVAIGEGAVVNVDLQIAKGVKSGYYDILLSQVSVCNEYGMSLTRPDTISVLHIENRLLGDVNDDGYVTVSDPVCLVSWLLERNPPIFIEEVADFNQDGVITTSDAVAIIRYLLSDAPTPEDSEPEMDQMSQLSVSSNGNGEINVELHNSRDYTAFMMDITLPEGMTLCNVILNPMRSTSHELAYSRLGGNKYRIIGFSTMLDTIIGDEGTLFALQTIGSSSGQMLINHIRFVDTNTVERALGSYMGSTTGVDNVEVDENNGVNYRIDGTRIGNVQRGVYIQNGKKTVKK